MNIIYANTHIVDMKVKLKSPLSPQYSIDDKILHPLWLRKSSPQSRAKSLR